MLRDKIILNNSLFLLCTECRSCGLKDHLIENCEKIHLVMNRSIKLRHYLQSKPILERKFILRRKKKLNSLRIFKHYANDIEESYLEDEEDRQSFEKQSVEMENNSKEEINSPFLLIDSQNGLRKDVITGNAKKNTFFSPHSPHSPRSPHPNYTNFACASTSKLLSNTVVNKENSELELDKLQNFTYYYPDFNFENVIKKWLPKKKSRNSLLKRKR